MSGTINEYLKDEMRADARNYERDALWEEFVQTYSDDDIYLDYCQEFNLTYDENEIDTFCEGEEYDEHVEVMFEQYCEHRTDSWN